MKLERLIKQATLLLVLFLIGLSVYYYMEQKKELANQPMPTALHPIVEEKKNRLIEQAAEKGITIVITAGFRSQDEQDNLYAQGRTDDGSIVTNAEGGQSYHNYGLAIDFALELTNGDIIWDLEYDGNENGQSDWSEVVAIAKELGFSWGGDWANFQDNPHLQMDFGLSIRDLQKGKRPDVE
ncbi:MULTISPECIES: M15 family metallopeptidase [Paraliobacillus]|uniref:M15 family metallopeptidase n=1 Tax=Paraliobacillus TaxID=200903 RepID=UPI000DD3FF59|nr:MULTISPECIES: M15 family metallopeptidase [Paraliobacillus]